MSKHWMVPALLLLGLALGTPAQARPDDDDRRGRHGDRHEDRDDDRRDHDDRKYWRERDREDRKYWRERDREDRKYERHHYYRDDDDRRRGVRPLAPPWMAGYWRPQERHYMALIPGDPSRCYVFVDGRWLLRRITDPRARLDIEGAFRLPVGPPPPIAPPRIGLDLHVVLFN